MSAPPKPDDVARSLNALSIDGTQAASASSAPTAAAAPAAAAAAAPASAAPSAASSSSSSSSSTPLVGPAALLNAAKSSGMSEEELRKLMGALQQGTAAGQSKAQAAAQKEYKFWSDQPRARGRCKQLRRARIAVTPC